MVASHVRQGMERWIHEAVFSAPVGAVNLQCRSVTMSMLPLKRRKRSLLTKAERNSSPIIRVLRGPMHLFPDYGSCTRKHCFILRLSPFLSAPGLTVCRMKSLHFLLNSTGRSLFGWNLAYRQCMNLPHSISGADILCRYLRMLCAGCMKPVLWLLFI